VPIVTTATTETPIPQGTWSVDPLHSSAGFEVEHAGVSTFRGGFKPIEARLVSGDEGVTLEGRVNVDSISIDDEDIRPHLLSPEFFDVERNPDITFRSTEVTGTADDLRVRGDLAMAGVSLQVEATGTLRGPAEVPGGGTKAALSLEATVDRTAYGMNWQMELPGGGQILANDVKLLVDLEFNLEG
jgi:polyisoprenoid-binding protein YceI